MITLFCMQYLLTESAQLQLVAKNTVVFVLFFSLL